MNLPAIFHKSAPLWPISFARIIIGVLWLLSLRWKLPPDFTPAHGRGLMDWFLLEVQHPAFDFYGQWVEMTVIPNFLFFAWLVFLAELGTGLSLLTGTLTRLGAFIGLLMSLNLGIGLLDVPGEWPWSYMMMIMWHGVFVVTAAGRVFGMDALLHKKLQRRNPWQWLV